MAAWRRVTVIGVAMVLLGLVQLGLFAVQDDWVPAAFGAVYAGLGLLYLWAEVDADRP